jgi:hypothetical protein
VAKDPVGCKVYYREMSILEDVLDERQFDVVRDREAVYVDVLLGAIKRGIRIGQFREVDPKMAAFAIVSLGAWASTWYNPSGTVDVATLADFFTDFAIRGLAA